jgi:hypothetical protein
LRRRPLDACAQQFAEFPHGSLSKLNESMREAARVIDAALGAKS